MNLYALCHEAKIVCDPSYYSGRGPTTSDLNEGILTRMHAAIVRERGDKAGEAFVEMVDSLKTASAT